MMSKSTPPTPFKEEYRQFVLDDLALLDSDPSPEFDRLVWLAKAHFGTAMALVSLVDRDRQWFKACCGLDATETPREFAFCAHAIMDTDALVVLDATRDPRFDGNPLVTGAPHIRFYAGQPLIVNDAAIGTLCIIDHKPRDSFGQGELESLEAFAQIVVDEIHLRDHLRQTETDLQEKMRDLQQLVDAGERAKSQFLATMSHELRTPLNAVIGFADCISQELMGPVRPPQYREFAEQISKGGRRQLDLVDRLLELTDAGSVGIKEEVLDLHALTRQCVVALSGEAMVHGVVIDVRTPEDPLSMLGDAIHIEQILLELIGNAIKFTPKGSRIDVELGVAEDGSAIVAVTDTGIGIDKDALGDALDVFGQIDTGYNREFEGAGIGLPIVKKLANLHGADLVLEMPEDGGTCAKILFPSYRTVD